MTNRNMNGKDDCVECGAGKMELDAEKGELECNTCGIVASSADILDTNPGKTTYGGESATHEVVRNNCDQNANMGTGGGYMDTKGLSASERKKWNRLRKVNRSTTRLKHPLAEAVRKKIKEMYGSFAMQAAEPFVKMMCKPLKGNLELQRQALDNKALKKQLGMPKQSICRKKTGVRGKSTELNIILLAMAAVEVAGELGLLSKMDRRAGMAQHDLTRKQLVNAKRTLLNHFKARIKMGWEEKPPTKTPDDIREDGVDQAVEHIHDMLDESLGEELLDEVNYETEARLALLGEGKTSALTANTEVRMAVCVAFFATLVSMGLQAGMADRLGAVFGMTGSGIRSRYEALSAAEKAGEGDYNGVFLRCEMTCLEILATLQPAHTLIQRVGLGEVWSNKEGSSVS
jgi:hypothetical protein